MRGWGDILSTVLILSSTILLSILLSIEVHKLVLRCVVLSMAIQLGLKSSWLSHERLPMSNVLLPVKVAGKSHAGWSCPALHAAPTNPLQRRQLSDCKLAGSIGKHLLVNTWFNPSTEETASQHGKLEERTEPSLKLQLYVILACSSFLFCCSLCFFSMDMVQVKCGTTSFATSSLTQRRCTMSRRTLSMWESSWQGFVEQALTRDQLLSSWRRCCNPYWSTLEGQGFTS